jgi:hypothetical protein
MASYKDLFEKTAPGSHGNFTDKVVARSIAEEETKQYSRGSKSIYALTAGLTAFAVLAGSVAFVLNGNDSDANLLTPAASDNVTTAAEQSAAPAKATEPVQSGFNYTVNENTFDFDITIADIFGDSRSAVAVFELTPKNGLVFEEDAYYWLCDVLEAHENDTYTSVSLLRYVNSLDVGEEHRFGFDSAPYGFYGNVENGKLYFSHVINTRLDSGFATRELRGREHKELILPGETFRLSFEKIKQSNQDFLTGELDLTFTLDYEPSETLTTDFNEAFYINGAYTVLERIELSQYGYRIYFSGGGIVSHFGENASGSRNMTGAVDYEIKFRDGSTVMLQEGYNWGNPDKADVSYIGEYSDADFVKYWGENKWGGAVELDGWTESLGYYVDVNEIESVIIGGLEFVLTGKTFW